MTSKPSIAWPRERAMAYWREHPEARVRIESLSRGDVFLSSEGDTWRYVRPDGALSGCHHVETLRTDERTTFAGRAEVLRVQS